jgi:hypothetical protein
MSIAESCELCDVPARRLRERLREHGQAVDVPATGQPLVTVKTPLSASAMRPRN